jgi:addiction module RelB/DinJ family antitoxin
MEMPASTIYQFRINEKEKAEAFAVLQELGLKPAQAIRLFLRQVKQTHSIPFSIEYTPNERAAKILLMPYEEQGFTPVNNVSDLLNDLDD